MSLRKFPPAYGSVVCICVSHPHCEKKRESIACEFIAVVVGSGDIVVTLLVITLFLRAKGGAKCMDACFTVRTRASAMSMSAKRSFTNMLDRMHDPEVAEARRQARVRANTTDVTDGTVEHLDNPVEGVEMAALGAEPSRRKFERYETEDGEEFFVQVGTEESVWYLPEDGEVVG